MSRVHTIRYRIAGLAMALALAGCQRVPTLGLPTYRIDIQQGNVVTQEMVEKLKPGMTRQQVRFLLGTPPIVDAFHVDRWDYVYYYNKGGKITEHRRLVLLFEADTLKRIEGDVVPAKAEPSAIAPKPPATGAETDRKPEGATAGGDAQSSAKPASAPAQ